MLETKLPVQMMANARCRNGRNGDTRWDEAGLVTRQGYPGPGGPPWAAPEQVGARWADGRLTGRKRLPCLGMGKLLDLGDVPGLRDPFLVIHLHGWTDAGMAGQTAAVFLRSRWNATPWPPSTPTS